MITALLSIWMMVIGMGVSVAHAHADGETQHVHGSGWNLNSSHSLPIKSSHGRGESHRHLILLGMEFPNESAPGMADANVTVPSIESTCDLPSLTDFVEFLAVLPITDLYRSLVPDCSIEGDSHLTDPSVSLSAFARRVLTGVLRS